jgi:hypothetical protein
MEKKSELIYPWTGNQYLPVLVICIENAAFIFSHITKIVEIPPLLLPFILIFTFLLE